MRLFQKHQLIVCGVVSVVMAAFLLLRHIPLHRSKEAVGKVMVAQELAMVEAQTRMEQMPYLREQVGKLRSEMGNFQAKVPRGRPAYGAFLEQITRLMDKHHLEEQLVQPQQELQTQQANCIPVSVQGKGSLKQIFNFFRSLQRLDRKIRISRVELTNSEEFSFGKSKLSVKAEVGIYYTVEN